MPGPTTLILIAGITHAAEGDDRLERLMFETSIGAGPRSESAYTQRLDDFGFDRSLFLYDSMLMLEGSVVLGVSENLSGVLTVGRLDSDSYHRDLLRVGGEDYDEFHSWDTWRLGLYGRYTLPLAGGWLVPYVQGGGGPAMALASYRDEDCELQERHMGVHLAAAAGLQVMPTFGEHRYVGSFVQVESSWAPVLENLTGDVHDSGHRALMFGVRAGY